jgi:quercetin dioxygenase-like cupin family protein
LAVWRFGGWSVGRASRADKTDKADKADKADLPLAPLASTPALAAQDLPPTGGSPWVLVPPFFARGALISLLGGNPNEPGPLHVRLVFPARYRMLPHSHPNDLHIQVLQGALVVGLGDKFDLKRTRAMASGDTATVPAGVHYFYAAKGLTILDVTSEGPFQLHYVHPDNDPSRSTPFGH